MGEDNSGRIVTDSNTAWGVYIHVPFCVSRCAYCDFNTYSGMGRWAGAYFDAMAAEMGAFFGGGGGGAGVAGVAGDAGAAYADTVFIGGGTPSSVDAAHIARILAYVPRAPGVPMQTQCTSVECTVQTQCTSVECTVSWECTLEANPGTLSADKLKTYAGAGVNRLSLGLQSTHAAHLRMLGRIHTFEDFIDSYRASRNAGFDNINVDLMFGLPGQTADEWERTLETVVSLGVRHLSCYSLSIEEGTPLYAAVAKGELPRPDEDLDRDMYHFAVKYLASAGIQQYELSNFAAPGRECLHNLKYWTGMRYRGFGAGAHSFDGRFRYYNASAIPDYIGRISGHIGSAALPSHEVTGAATISGHEVTGAAAMPSHDVIGAAAMSGNEAVGSAAMSGYEVIDAAEREKEFIILRLRLSRGFFDEEFRAGFGYSFTEKYAAEIKELVSSGLMSIGPGPEPPGPALPGCLRSAGGRRVRLTPLGMDLANRVFRMFI